MFPRAVSGSVRAAWAGPGTTAIGVRPAPGLTLLRLPPTGLPQLPRPLSRCPSVPLARLCCGPGRWGQQGEERAQPGHRAWGLGGCRAPHSPSWGPGLPVPVPQGWRPSPAGRAGHRAADRMCAGVRWSPMAPSGWVTVAPSPLSRHRGAMLQRSESQVGRGGGLRASSPALAGRDRVALGARAQCCRPAPSSGPACSPAPRALGAQAGGPSAALPASATSSGWPRSLLCCLFCVPRAAPAPLLSHPAWPPPSCSCLGPAASSGSCLCLQAGLLHAPKVSTPVGALSLGMPADPPPVFTVAHSGGGTQHAVGVRGCRVGPRPPVSLCRPAWAPPGRPGQRCWFSRATSPRPGRAPLAQGDAATAVTPPPHRPSSMTVSLGFYTLSCNVLKLCMHQG